MHPGNTKSGGADPKSAAGLQHLLGLFTEQMEQRVLLLARRIADERGEVAVTICARNAAWHYQQRVAAEIAKARHRTGGGVQVVRKVAGIGLHLCECVAADHGAFEWR